MLKKSALPKGMASRIVPNEFFLLVFSQFKGERIVQSYFMRP